MTIHHVLHYRSQEEAVHAADILHLHFINKHKSVAIQLCKLAPGQYEVTLDQYRGPKA